MNNENEAFWTGYLISMALMVFLSLLIMTFDRNIESGKSFIIKNASYECVKTNELKEK